MRRWSGKPGPWSHWRFRRNGSGSSRRRSEAIAAELQTALAAAGEVTRGIADLKARLAGLGYSETAFKSFRETEQAAERARRDAELALVRGRAERKAAAEAVEAVIRRQAERDQRERAAAETAMELALHQELDRALTDLRDDLNSSLRPDLSDLASAFPQRPHRRSLRRSWSSTRTIRRRCSTTEIPRPSSPAARRTCPISRSGWPSAR